MLASLFTTIDDKIRLEKLQNFVYDLIKSEIQRVFNELCINASKFFNDFTNLFRFSLIPKVNRELNNLAFPQKKKSCLWFDKVLS